VSGPTSSKDRDQRQLMWTQLTVCLTFGEDRLNLVMAVPLAGETVPIKDLAVLTS